MLRFLVWLLKFSGSSGRRSKKFDKRKFKGGWFKASPPPLPSEYQHLICAQTLWVIDGDTLIVINQNNTESTLRLAAIDCPEDNQDWGDIAKFALIKMVGKNSIYYEDHGTDIYDRLVATVYLSMPDGTLQNINERMVMLGHAWVMPQYYQFLPLHRRQKLHKLEAWACNKKIGLWQNESAIPPWKWRE